MPNDVGEMSDSYIDEPSPQGLKVRDLKPERTEEVVGHEHVEVDVNGVCRVHAGTPAE